MHELDLWRIDGLPVKSYLGRGADNYPIIHHGKGLVTRAFSIINRLTAGLLARSLFLPPSFIQIEPTTKCNLRCTSCLRTRTCPDISADMSMDIFKTIIDSVSSPLLVKPVTKLFGLGEPLLNPHISSMVQYAKEKGLEVDLVSNFTLVSRDISEKFIEAQLDSMSVSLDSASPEIFEKTIVSAIDAISSESFIIVPLS